MSEEAFFNTLLWSYLALTVPVFVVLLFVPAPYGRYTRERFGPTIDRRLGWVLMELPSAAVFAVCFFVQPKIALPAVIFLLMWESHYLHRSLIFPFQMRGGRRHMTYLAASLGVLFNLGNAYLNGRHLFALGSYSVEWIIDPRFLSGFALFATGFGINRWADRTLERLRAPGESDYRIPHGGLFVWVSCPNYSGEILQWCGWALCTWSLPAFAFALWTIANLLPRALWHHRWYREKFADYPAERKALIPFLL